MGCDTPSCLLKILAPKMVRLTGYNIQMELACSLSVFFKTFFVVSRDINEFPRLLTLAMELLLVSCDDNEADVRLVAGESINKIMKVLHCCYFFCINSLLCMLFSPV